MDHTDFKSLQAGVTPVLPAILRRQLYAEFKARRDTREGAARNSA